MSDYSRIYEEVFYADGSLRDIYVQETDEKTWQALLNFLHLATYPIEFIVGGQLRPLPERIEDIFILTHDYTINLRIDEGYLALHCHFFTSEEIEFDLDPRDFYTEQQVIRLLDFIRAIGKWLCKEVVLTPENMREIPLFRFHPATDKEEWLF